jgi:hypothetical protein
MVVSPQDHNDGFADLHRAASPVRTLVTRLLIKRRSVMDLVQFVIILIVIGVLLWLVNNYIPMDRKIKQILNGMVVVGVVLWIGNLFGVFDSLRGFHIGK